MLKLLLIDDDEELCSELKEVLEAQAFDVDTVCDGKEGLQLLLERQYHILILDLKLPGLNGYGVLKTLRERSNPIKILVLSGRPLGEPLLKEEGVSQDDEKILNLADVVMNKPFMVESFLHKIKNLSTEVKAHL